MLRFPIILDKISPSTLLQ